jgi:integrase
MGLGPYPDVSLAEARRSAGIARTTLKSGTDPVEARRAQAAQAKTSVQADMTFDESAVRYIESYSDGWKNKKHAAQWHSTIKTYVSPVFGSHSVRSIDTALVLKALEPIWRLKPETANRLRGRMEQVLDWAKVRGFREGENPARWRGHLSKILPAISKIHKVKHQSSLPYHQLPDFMADVRSRTGLGAAALELLILTAARTGEIIGMRGEEIDWQNALWVVPASRMKGSREHIVPLSIPALSLLKRLNPKPGQFVFPGQKSDTSLSNMALLKTIERMNEHREVHGLPRYTDPQRNSDITAHGFRATFKTWANEQTAFPNDLIEAALAHVKGDKVEAAYLRGTLIERRRQVMETWAQFAVPSQLEVGIADPALMPILQPVLSDNPT